MIVTFSRDSIFLLGESTYDWRIRSEGMEASMQVDSETASGGRA